MEKSEREALELAEVRQGVLHARVRWLGTALLPLSVLLLLGTVALLVMGRAPWYDVLLGVACCGLSIGSFGTHNDTALALLRERRGHGGIPSALALEMDREFLFRRLDLSDLKATPRMAWGISVVALGLVTFLLIRLVLP